MILGNALAGGQDAWILGGGAIGLAVSLLVLKMTEKKRADREEWSPRLVQVLEKGETAEQLGPM